MNRGFATSRFLQTVATAGFLLGAAPTQTNAVGPLGFGIVQPRTYHSASSTFSLHIRPHDRWGHGGANYRIVKNGQELWSGDKPYTLRAVTMTDSGYAVGIAYRDVEVERDGKRRNPDQYFHFVILNSDGAEVVNDVYPRHRVHHSYSEPHADQLIVDAASDRVVLRVQGKEKERGDSPFGEPSWWVYRLSDGHLLERFDPRERDPQIGNAWRLIDARLVPGSPFVATHWFTLGENYKPEERASYFSIVGVDGVPIWWVTADGDYTSLDLKWKRGRDPVADFFRNSPALRIKNEKQQFELRCFANDEVTCYTVESDSSGNWNVSEHETVRYVPAELNTTSTTAARGELIYLGPVELGASREVASPLGRIHRFTFDKSGNIHFSFSDETKQWRTRAVNAAGEIIKEANSDEVSGRVCVFWNDCPWLGDDKYVEVHQLAKDRQEYEATLVDLTTGKSTPLPGYPGGYAKSISRSRDGGFALINDDGLTRYDGEGKLLWLSDTRDILGTMPWSVACLVGGKLALLTGDEIKLIDRQGHLEKSIDLTGAFDIAEDDGFLGYLHEVVADAEGGFLIKNSRNPPVVLRYDANGTLRSRWSPRFSDGRIVTIDPGLRVARDGRLWTSDGRRFLRLTDDGVVDHTVGPARDGDALTGLAGFTVGWNGKWYAVESDTGAVYVFDGLGRRELVAKPRPQDFTGSVKKAHVAINSSGDIFVKRPSTIAYLPLDEYLRFDQAGQPKEVVTFEPRINMLGAGWNFQPGTNFRCGMCSMRGDKRLVVLDQQNQIVRETRQRPNGKWFGHTAIFAMAPDGTMAVLTTEKRDNERQYALDLFTTEADSIRTIPLPAPTEHYSGLAYDGTRAVIVGENETVIVSLTDDTISKRTLSGLSAAKRSWKPFMIADGRELLLFDRLSKELHRYELP